MQVVAAVDAAGATASVSSLDTAAYEMVKHNEAPASTLDDHDYEAGSGRALSVPRRRSLIPPWVVGAMVTVLLPLAVAVAIFAPWFWVSIQPQRDLIDRMTPTDCAVVGHFGVDTKAVAGNMMLLYLAGLRVHFRPDGESQVSAVAMPRLMRDQAWMGADVLADYFARHPVNGTSRCYYDHDDPPARVAMRDDIDGLDTSIGYCVGATLLAYFVVLFVVVIVAGPCLCY
ncbi:hypothetical protein [Mollivirus kamchatka]|nr:hypothetical protein [Mollivirus kamchatka]